VILVSDRALEEVHELVCREGALFCPRAQAAGLDARFELLHMTVTSPAHAIADAAAGIADLIVLGNVGSGPLKGLLLGSVAYRMLQIAPCPVLVVPKSDR
jgi:nucleotide-binding universal stress UspA family protein